MCLREKYILKTLNEKGKNESSLKIVCRHNAMSAKKRVEILISIGIDSLGCVVLQ